LKGGEILKEYDCIVVGQDLYSMTVALFLSRKMRKVLIIQDQTSIIGDYEKINLKQGEKTYKFQYYRDNVVAGLEKSGLLYEYLDNLGLIKALNYNRIENEFIIGKDGNIKKRSNSLEQFRIYLVRHYPKNRKEIYRFFDDLHRHYKNYLEQYLNMLKNKEYTLSSLMIEWGDYSLKELLDKYFSNQELIEEFLVNDFVNGLDLEEINAFSFFSNYLVGLESNFYSLKHSYKEITEKLIERIKLVNPSGFINTTVKKYMVNEKKEIEYLVDSQNKKIKAKYYFISDNPFNFYDKYFSNCEEDLEILKTYYPNLDTKKRINTLYLVLNTKLTDIEINESFYYFKNNQSDEIKLVRLYNYTLETNQDLRKKEGLLCLDFSYDEDTSINKEIIIQKLDDFLPKIRKFLTATKLGKPKPYLSMIRDEKVRRNLSINEMIDVESIEHIQVIENLFVGGEFIRPEAKFFGIINQGIVFGDKIEDKLYYGDDDNEYQYFTNDEIMMMIRHNYDYQYFGNKETHVNFHIGKHIYFIRTKGKNIVVHQGKHANPDLSIYTTNDKLAELLLKKTSFKDVLDSGSLKYQGDVNLLFTVIKAFNLDDYQEFKEEDYIISKYKFQGVKFLFAHLFIYALASFLSNFYQNLLIFPFALVLSLLISFIKFKIYERTSWFELIVNFVLAVYTVLSIFVVNFNHMYSDNIFLGLIIFVLMLSVFINQPIVYLYHKFDMSIDYRNTKLFKIITNGLTFIWGFIFLIILGGTYIAGDRYVSVFYSLYFFGIFMTYFYPIIYVRTSIKKK